MFKVGDKNYKVGRLSTFQQYHVARKLSPVLLAMANVENPEEIDAEKFSKLAVVVSAGLPDQVAEDGLRGCLRCVEVQVMPGGTWAPFIEPNTGALMYDGLPFGQLWQIAWYVLKHYRIPDFFSTSPSASAGATGQNLPASPAVKTGS